MNIWEYLDFWLGRDFLDWFSAFFGQGILAILGLRLVLRISVLDVSIRKTRKRSA